MTARGPIAPFVNGLVAHAHRNASVDLEGGRLYYSREGMAGRTELLPISDTLFAFGDGAQVEFVREGSRVSALRILTQDGQAATLPRTK